MKPAQFNDEMARVFGVPQKTMVTYTRFMKEGDLLTTGARGVNAPHSTPLDAARVTIALLTCDTPGQAVERVKRFGPIPFNPSFKRSWPWYANIGQDCFTKTFRGETLEEVLAFMFGRVGEIGLAGAAKWFRENNFSLRINDFSVLAELVSWKLENGKPVGEIVAPFRGDPWDNSEHPKITGRIRTTRETMGLNFFEISAALVRHAGEGGRYRGVDPDGNPLDPEHPWNKDLPPHEREKRLVEIETYIAKLEAERGGG